LAPMATMTRLRGRWSSTPRASIGSRSNRGCSASCPGTWAVR
jgi:hypothetical protein